MNKYTLKIAFTCTLALNSIQANAFAFIYSHTQTNNYQLNILNTSETKPLNCFIRNKSGKWQKHIVAPTSNEIFNIWQPYNIYWSCTFNNKLAVSDVLFK